MTGINKAISIRGTKMFTLVTENDKFQDEEKTSYSKTRKCQKAHWVYGITYLVLRILMVCQNIMLCCHWLWYHLSLGTKYDKTIFQLKEWFT